MLWVCRDEDEGPDEADAEAVTRFAQAAAALKGKDASDRAAVQVPPLPHSLSVILMIMCAIP